MSYRPINSQNPHCACDGCQDGIPDDFKGRTGGPIFKIEGCGCPIQPLTCHRCRSLRKSVRCKHCGVYGVTTTIKKPKDNITYPINTWHKLRQRRLLKSSKFMMMAKDWRFFTRNFILQQTMTGFKDWLQTQGKSGATRVGSELTTLQVLSMKDVTFTRLLIFKLHRNATNKIDFYLWQKVVAAVIRRIISNFASLHQQSEY